MVWVRGFRACEGLNIECGLKLPLFAGFSSMPCVGGGLSGGCVPGMDSVGALACGDLGRFLAGREMDRERVDGPARQDLGRRCRS